MASHKGFLMKTRVLVSVLLVVGLAAGCEDEDGLSPLAGPDTGVPVDAIGGSVDAPVIIGGDGGTDASLSDGGTADTNTSGDVLPSLGDANADSGVLTAMAMFTPAAGGTLSLSGAKLVALAGALAADKTITVTASSPPTTLPNAADIVGMVFDFGPDGTAFAGPVELSLPVNSAAVAGKPWTIARFDETAKTWVAIPTTWSAGDAQAVALVSNVTRFAILLGTPAAGGPTGAKASVCPATANCGGALEGSYGYTSSCETADPATQLKSCGQGAKALITTTARVTGTIAFTGATFEQSTTKAATADIRAGADCTASYKGVGATSCSDVANRLMADHTWACSGSIDTQCFCAGAATAAAQVVAGTFTALNGKLALTGAGVPPLRPMDYCVAGNAVTLRESSGAVRTLRKQ